MLTASLETGRSPAVHRDPADMAVTRFFLDATSRIDKPCNMLRVI